MFAPMTSQTEYARFEAETRERTRRAGLNTAFAPRASLISRLAARFTGRTQHSSAPAVKVTSSEHTAAAC